MALVSQATHLHCCKLTPQQREHRDIARPASLQSVSAWSTKLRQPVHTGP